MARDKIQGEMQWWIDMKGWSVHAKNYKHRLNFKAVEVMAT